MRGPAPGADTQLSITSHHLFTAYRQHDSVDHLYLWHFWTLDYHIVWIVKACNGHLKHSVVDA